MKVSHWGGRSLFWFKKCVFSERARLVPWSFTIRIQKGSEILPTCLYQMLVVMLWVFPSCRKENTLMMHNRGFHIEVWTFIILDPHTTSRTDCSMRSMYITVGLVQLWTGRTPQSYFLRRVLVSWFRADLFCFSGTHSARWAAERKKN